MAASEELYLIAKILDTGHLQEVIDSGISLDSFGKGTDSYRAFKYIYNYWRDRRTMGNVPTREIMEAEIPTIDLPIPDRLKVNAAVDEMKKFIIYRKLEHLQEKLDGLVQDYELHEAVSTVQRYSAELSTISHPSTDLDLAASKDDILRAYEANKNRRGLRGLPWPWETLNRETEGIINSEFTVLYGRPKSMKTWLMLHIAVNVYQNANGRVLIYTREMPPEALRKRIVSLLIEAPYSAFKESRLHTIKAPEGGTLEDRFYDVVSMLDDDTKADHELKHHRGIIITSDRENKYGGGVMGLREKVNKHKPDLICVDGVYLMRNDREGKRSMKWDSLTAITQDLHDLCLDVKRPLIGTTQANRGSEDAKGELSMRGMAFSDSFAQDCDLAINVIRKPGTNQTNTELALVITGARETFLHGFAVHGTPAEDFSEIMVPKKEHGQVVLGEGGDPVLAPLVFHSAVDVKRMLKDEEERDKVKAAVAANRFSRKLKDVRDRVERGSIGPTDKPVKVRKTIHRASVRRRR